MKKYAIFIYLIVLLVNIHAISAFSNPIESVGLEPNIAMLIWTVLPTIILLVITFIFMFNRKSSVLKLLFLVWPVYVLFLVGLIFTSLNNFYNWMYLNESIQNIFNIFIPFFELTSYNWYIAGVVINIVISLFMTFKLNSISKRFSSRKIPVGIAH